MFRTLLASAGLLLLVPAVASAAPFGELPFQPVAGSATCLRATGTPGELVRQSEQTVQLVTASPAGLTAGATLAADGIRGCAETASWAGGGGVVAFAVSSDLEDELWARVYVREPGGGWGEPVDVIAPEEQPFSSSLATAASERGDALVALASVTSDARAHVRVVRRLPGGAFGVTETLHSRRTGEPFPPIVHAGLSASGEAIVLWTVEPVKDERSGDERSARGRAERELWAAIAPPGAPFGAPKLIDPIASSAPYDLTVAPDGRALVVFGSGDQLVAAERPPGGVFGYPFTVADTIDEFGSAPTSVLRPDGAAIIAWAGLTDGTMSVRTRTAPGIFGPAITLGRAHRIERPVFASLTRLIDTALSGLQGEFGLGGAPPDARGANPRAALGTERSGDERSARGRDGSC